ncbi:DUF1615 domain-containing protein [Pseudomonas sp. FFUP_PS_473]|uniref:DUF1615 domain-containing protein n=1 Tax=unclassified Pseudomonas TaxID=196821 RepID=UPI000C186F79|nr:MULTISPECIES: DUF1615 domain-containing protein [unclassified Pseudomonas]ATR82691.1 hypothetical protein CS390_09015 [Pseudomonas sp. HLS-6]PLP92443.1 DUF1615 domain-containing protein [Pseudomonas sp. FFUP_PS_473]
MTSLRLLLCLAVLLVLAGCASPRTTQPASPAELRAQIARLLPANLADRQGWAKDIQVAFTHQGIAATRDNLCAALAVTEQESTFQADPSVPGLGRIAREEIDRRAARLHVPQFLVNAALNTRSPSGKSYSERLETVRSERQLSAIFDDLISTVPMGRTLLGGLNPVRTGGPMQVSIAFAERHAKGYPYTYTGTIRQEVFSRRGGLYFGIAHLLAYPANYDRQLYRFADFNAGWYASRNAAFQHAVSRASGVSLALDGDLIAPGAILPGATERAVRQLGDALDMRNPAIRSQLEEGDSLAFESTRLYRRVYALAEQHEGKPLPRALLPGIVLESPKITRTLTTAWFANRVEARYQRCMQRG